MSKVSHFAGRLGNYSNNALLDLEEGIQGEDAPDIEFEPVCPRNGWSMNEIWKYAYISPPPGWYIMEDSGPFRGAYDYGEPAGYPTPSDPHSTLPGDWTTKGEQVVSFIPMTEAGSQVRKQTEKKKTEQ